MVEGMLIIMQEHGLISFHSNTEKLNPDTALHIGRHRLL